MRNKINFIVGSLITLAILTGLNLGFDKSQPLKIDEIEVNNSMSHVNKFTEPLSTVTSDNVEVVIAKHLMTIETTTLEQLIETSELGVNGIVKDATNYIFTDINGEKTPYTKITLFVDHVYNGDTSLLNSEITILEYGGIMTKLDMGIQKKFPKMRTSELFSRVDILSEGLPHTKVGQEMAAFLYEETDMDTGFKFYQFTSDYRSKFYLDESTEEYERPVPEDMENLVKNDKKEEILNQEITTIVENNLSEEQVVEELIK